MRANSIRAPRSAPKSGSRRPTEALGRISAQTAKQVILQKVREAERETIHSEYSGRVGELVNCTVKRIEGQDLVVDLGKTEARSQEGAVQAGQLQRRRPRTLRDQERGEGRQERGRHRVPRRSRTRDAPVRAGSARDLRRHGRHQRRARAKPASERKSRCRAATATSTASAPASG